MRVHAVPQVSEPRNFASVTQINETANLRQPPSHVDCQINLHVACASR